MSDEALKLSGQSFFAGQPACVGCGGRDYCGAAHYRDGYGLVCESDQLFD